MYEQLKVKLGHVWATDSEVRSCMSNWRWSLVMYEQLKVKLGHVWAITCHRKPWNVITYPCPHPRELTSSLWRFVISSCWIRSESSRTLCSSPVPPERSNSLTRFFIRALSSLYAANCFFHSSTLAVLSCNAVVSRALLFFNVWSSTSHFLALAELEGKKTGGFIYD